MNRRTRSNACSGTATATSEMLLLPDGQLLVHNLTPELAALLGELNPSDSQIAPLSLSAKEHEKPNIPHALPG